MQESQELSATLEDYLEAVCRLEGEKGGARVRDIADALSVHKSTVSSALKGLAERGLVNYSPYEVTTITPQGRRVAQEIMGRHEMITRFLADVLALGESEAESNACRMEHVVDAEVMKRLSLFAEFLRQHPHTSKDWAAQVRRCIPEDTRPQ